MPAMPAFPPFVHNPAWTPEQTAYAFDQYSQQQRLYMQQLLTMQHQWQRMRASESGMSVVDIIALNQMSTDVSQSWYARYQRVVEGTALLGPIPTSSNSSSNSSNSSSSAGAQPRLQHPLACSVAFLAQTTVMHLQGITSSSSSSTLSTRTPRHHSIRMVPDLLNRYWAVVVYPLTCARALAGLMAPPRLWLVLELTSLIDPALPPRSPEEATHPPAVPPHHLEGIARPNPAVRARAVTLTAPIQPICCRSHSRIVVAVLPRLQILVTLPYTRVMFISIRHSTRSISNCLHRLC